jgi:hypothetical protein
MKLISLKLLCTLASYFGGPGFDLSPVTCHFELSFILLQAMSRDSVVGIATSYGLDDRGVGVRVPIGSGIFSYPNRPDRL